jgi:hypothetical protein
VVTDKFNIEEVDVMKTNGIFALSLVAAFAVSPCVQAKKYTIYDREVALERKIDKAYKANQLTLKESDSLKNKIKDIKENEQDMKNKNGGKLSYENMNDLEKSLNKVSNKLNQKMLDKRTQ